jgi:hypothetical protein
MHKPPAGIAFCGAEAPVTFFPRKISDLLPVSCLKFICRSVESPKLESPLFSGVSASIPVSFLKCLKIYFRDVLKETQKK